VGNRIGELPGRERREPVDLDQVPQLVIDAVTAVEDAAFYEHDGVDHRAIARAAIQTNPLVPGLGGSGRQPGSALKSFVAATALELVASHDHPMRRPRVNT